MPKACPNELFFIPNPNAPDFLYMLGLDQVVGRVLKDKNAIRYGRRTGVGGSRTDFILEYRNR